VEMKGSRVVSANVEQTWAALNDPEVLRSCIPGCESIERTGEDTYRAAMTARVGPVSAKFSGQIALADIVAPSSYTIRFEGQGGAAGFANGEARVGLVAENTGTRIDYSANAQVGGKLAQIGSRLVDGAAAKVADDFFNCLASRLGAAAPLTPPPQARATVTPPLKLRLALVVVILVVMAIYWMTRS
jgi:uncharacterized protein